MSDQDTAMAELDRLGRQAASALRAAAQQVTATTIPVADAGRAEADAGPADADLARNRLDGPDRNGQTDPVLFDFPPASDGDRHGGRATARWPRLALAAAAVSALVGVGVVNATRDDDRSLAESTVGAPSAALGDGASGIYPPDAERRGLNVASPEHTEAWDQWTITVTDAGQHLLLDLQSGDTVVTSVLGDLGAEPLQLARVDAADTLPGADETALFGTVDRTVMGAGRGGGTVTVERPGAEPVDLYVEPVEGATHNVFVGFVPGDLGPEAVVVARGPGGREISRVPVPSADDGAGDPGGAEGSIFPDDPDHPTVQVGGAEGTGPDEIHWSGRVLGGGRYVELGAIGNEDSITTMIDRPASHALQVLATRLDGDPDRPVVVVYGLVEAGAVTVELTTSGSEPVPLDLLPIEGATHHAFGAIVPPDVDEAAVVVARDAGGREIGRRPLAWTQFDAARPG